MTVSDRLFSRNFTLLWQGQFVSALGTSMLQVGMLFWLLEATGSATTMGLLLMFSSLPGVISSVFAGVLVDRFNRKHLIVISDIVLGSAILSLAVPFLFFPEFKALAIGWFFVVLTTNSVVMSVFRPATIALVPEITSPKNLDAANSAIGGSQAITQIVGQGLGGVLFLIVGPGGVALLNGLLFTISAFSESLIQLPRKFHGEKSQPSNTISEDFRTGLEHLWTQKGLLNLILLGMFLNFLLMPIGIILPFIVRDQLGLDADWFGYALAALGVGSVVGFTLFSKLDVDGSTRYAVVFVSEVLIGSSMFALPESNNSLSLCIIMFVIGIALPPLNVSLVSLLQATTPESLRGRVSSLMSLGTGAIVPIALGMSGLIFDAIEQNVELFERTAAVLFFLTSVYFLTRPSVRVLLSKPLR